MVLRLGTRASALARAQAEQVRAALLARHVGLVVEPVLIRTTGDRLARDPLAAVGGKGLFLKEIEEALVAGTIDFAVHSMKDVPARLAEGCVIAAVPARADPRDVLVGGGGVLAGLPPGTRVGTASVRRRAQLLARRCDLVVDVLRGNVDTRLARWRAGAFDCLVLAAAGLARLGVVVPEARPVPTDELLPAVGQGALALECRADDARTRALLGELEDPAARTAIAAERAFLAAIGGDCGTPLAAHATVGVRGLRLRAEVLAPDGVRRLAAAGEGAVAEAEALGRRL
ncbi:MAG TPA: hydroxymethylbilane synthase, partial [Candidatus Binatia bacterium]|nr:hydroxymethylbilane synthase [Candidatus Binatia bacterium]